jgi:catechol 2,3-dioxygenase-like lactoylglutathione lyase family enzyme
MTWYAGRLLDHVHLNVGDLDRSAAFYTAVLAALGLPAPQRGPDYLQADELFLSLPAPGRPLSSVHIAFQAGDRETVQRFHAAALQAGGRDNGSPGERDYHPGYYAAFVFDPDDNNIEAVFHGPVKRSAPSIELEPME